FCVVNLFCFFFSSRRRHTRSLRDWSSDVCSSDLCCYQRCNQTLTSGCIVDSNNTFAIIEPFQETIAHPIRFTMLQHRTIPVAHRSEERRVGKECRSQCGTDQYKKKSKNTTTQHNG